MNFWRGGDVSVIKNTRDIPKEEGWYPKDQYIVSNSAYDVSWVMCELRDIYISPKNAFTLERIGKWSVIQVVKLFLGMPIIPGR